MYTIIEKFSKKRLRYIALICVKFAEHLVSQRVNDIIVTVVHIGLCQYEVDNLTFLIA